jgi:CRP-like cAMP-binding protein
MISPQELRELRLFKDASANAVARLASAMREQKCPMGTVILKEGGESAGLHLVAEGTVAVRKRIAKDTWKVVAHFGKGEFFGEMSLLDREQRASAEVVAETDVRLFVLTHADFMFLMSKAPTEAMDHLSTLLTGLSTRLRQTTRELVTVYQVARNVGSFETAAQLGRVVVDLLAGMLGDATTIAFYRWNPFNDEYTRAVAVGPLADALPAVVDDRMPIGSADGTASYPDTRQKHPLRGVQLPPGHLVVSRSDLGPTPQGLFVYFTAAPHVFERGDRQVMETVSAVLAPAFETARAREEEQARRDYEEKKQRFA